MGTSLCTGMISLRSTVFIRNRLHHAPQACKYDDQPNDKPTDFSADPVTGIELAKQRAQEVAARLLSGAPPPDANKRPRPDSGFDSLDAKPRYSSVPPPVSYAHQGTSKKIDILNGRVGVIIGKVGETIKYLQLQFGAKIQVTRDMDADPNSLTRMVELMGTPDAIAGESGGSGIIARRLTGQSGSDEFSMKIPNNKVSLIIGKGGETIKNMQTSIGARIQLFTNINRPRNPAMSGGYPQQGYQSRPPSNWSPLAPMQQPGYGYMQPGAYSGPSPHYNMPQAPYGGYPPQQPGGYSTNWDQSTAPPHQQSSHAGSYDYYSQQPPQSQNHGGPAPPVDSSAYNYSQAPSSGYNQPGQGYGQDNYNSYNVQSQSGYGQPPTYEQQQGYGSATGGYGSGNNPTQEGHTANYASQGDSTQATSAQPTTTIPQQGYLASQQPGSNTASYPPQGTQTSYGVPPTSQAAYGNQPQHGYGTPQSQKLGGIPPVYGQSQSPSAVGYGQSGYPAQPLPSGYAQPESRAPPSGYGGAGQPGYAPQTYGAPPQGYGQTPPPYNNSSYVATGYTQTAAYTGDGNASGNAQAPQNPVAKASPQS
ncbi:hypothetical protein Fmac_000541 [Flemingia macrophylla]|uniref:K Homology domain-containing protein n=1 Tax=Flemingia macrophylla TaxID=520843 RepID=A0ABD1NEI8_9FABA